tara:strand:+ start:110 stop:469 length:360 start_codon:yes stop_codon:yes gene_type:complete
MDRHERLYLFVNEGSRGEIDHYIGDDKKLNELLNDYFNLHDNDMMELKFGGLSDLDCFCEMIFDEEDCFKIYIVDGRDEIKSDLYEIRNFEDEDDYELHIKYLGKSDWSKVKNNGYDYE